MIFWLKPNFGQMVGYGHLSRLIAIAEELVFRKHIYCFHYSNSQDLVANGMMNLSSLSFGCQCQGECDFLIIDNYTELTKHLETSDHHRPKTVQIVDDITPMFYADAYIQASPISHWAPANNQAAVLEFDTSPILRKRFDLSDSLKSSNNQQNNKILISLGASKCIEQSISSIKRAIEKSKYKSSDLYCILSGTELNLLRQILYKNRIIPIEPGKIVAEIAFDFDFVISACGVTAWELLCSKVPCLFIGVAENQRNQLNYLVKFQIADGLMFENQNQFVPLFIEKLNKFSCQKTAKKIGNGRIRAVDWIENLNSI